MPKAVGRFPATARQTCPTPTRSPSARGTRFTTAASIAPVPELVSTSTSLLGRKRISARQHFGQQPAELGRAMVGHLRAMASRAGSGTSSGRGSSVVACWFSSVLGLPSCRAGRGGLLVVGAAVALPPRGRRRWGMPYQLPPNLSLPPDLSLPAAYSGRSGSSGPRSVPIATDRTRPIRSMTQTMPQPRATR